MNNEELKIIAEKYVAKESIDNVEIILVDDETIYDKKFNVYFYQSKKFIEDGNIEDMLVGNCPIIISKIDGKIYETGTADDIEYYIENFRKYGDPNPIEVQKANIEKDFDDIDI